MIIAENTLVINYNDGDEINGPPGRSVTLTITCDPEMNTINLTSMNNVDGSLKYVATATSKYACTTIKCNGHGIYTPSACICYPGYAGTHCDLILATIGAHVISLVFNVVEGIIIVTLVIIIILLYRRIKSYTSMSPSSLMNDIDLEIDFEEIKKIKLEPSNIELETH